MTKLIGCLAALLVAGASQARNAELLDFSAAPPASKAAAPTPPEPEASFAQPPADPAPAGVEISSLTDRLRIPAWMAPKRSRFFAALPSIPPGVAAMPEAGCTWEPYRPNPRLGLAAEARRARYYGVMAAAACEAGVPTNLFDALVTQESGYNPMALSPKGAVGLSQLMPDTAARLGVGNAWDVVQNLRGGARYLRRHLDEFRRYDLALGAYNAGPGRVRRFGRVPAFRETLMYVGAILGDLRSSLTRRAVPVDAPSPAGAAAARTASLFDFG